MEICSFYNKNSIYFRYLGVFERNWNSRNAFYGKGASINKELNSLVTTNNKNQLNPMELSFDEVLVL